LQQWVQAFGDHGIAQGICGDSLLAQFQAVETMFESTYHDCMRLPLRDGNPATPALDPSCSAVDYFVSATATPTSAPLPPCTTATSATPCWQIAPDASCGGRDLFTTQRPLGSPVPFVTLVTCDVCPPGAVLAGCP
jgi:hypothetical protein